MILWTIVPEEIVFADQNQPTPYEELEFEGQRVMAERVSPNEFRVVRLLTTAPEDYLRNDLQPGTRITLEPVIKAFS